MEDAAEDAYFAAEDDRDEAEAAASQAADSADAAAAEAADEADEEAAAEDLAMSRFGGAGLQLEAGCLTYRVCVVGENKDRQTQTGWALAELDGIDWRKVVVVMVGLSLQWQRLAMSFFREFV